MRRDKMRKRNIIIFVIFLLIVLFFTGGSWDACAKKEPIQFGDGGWESARFHNEGACIIIEEGYGYKTEEVTGSTAAIMTGIENNDIDVHMEIWSENVMDIYEPGLEEGYYIKQSVNFDDNFQGLYVPTYVIEGDPERGIEPMAPDLKYITDLPDYWELFKDQIGRAHV